MQKNVHKRYNMMQNVAIALLSVSAVLLFAQTQLYNLGATAGSDYWNRLGSSSTIPAPLPNQSASTLSAPVRLAVTGAFGRYGDLQLTTASEAFVAPAALLSEALSSAGAIAPCRKSEFPAALTGTSVYYDFLFSLPLSVLAQLTATQYSGDGSARRLLLAETGSGVTLYLRGAENDWSRCTTSITQEQLANFVADYELGNANFSLDNAETDASFAVLDPYSLFLTESPELPNLFTANPLTDIDSLLSALSFNPHTNARYPESDGTEVIMEGDSSVRIQPDGMVLYQSGGLSTLTIPAKGDSPTTLESVTGASALLRSLLGNLTGEAGLYLQGVQSSGENTVLHFGYHMDGTPIRFAGGNVAAEITLQRTAVSSFSLRFRQYTTTESHALLLPLTQAAAIAATQHNAELSIAYVDNGEDSVKAAWLADE